MRLATLMARFMVGGSTITLLSPSTTYGSSVGDRLPGYNKVANEMWLGITLPKRY